ncbi:MAG: acyl carrier protein [Lachnospiraceae bacterium]|nr:acyl carrier protein [Lachnospiraceae bacterium]
MREKVLSILKEVNEEIPEYEGDALLEDGIIASLDVIEIVSALEDEFDITIAAKYITKENFATVDSICALVESLQ